MTFEVGSTVDRYRLEAVIGEGGMGRVFRAHDPRLGRRVAVKLLGEPGDDAVANAEAASRMVREARAAAAFTHPNVVAIYDVGEADGTPFIAMELVEGTSLRAFVGDAATPQAQKIAWLLDIARGLGAAHRAGLVHRDVKPENVLVTTDGTAKILDFGIARRADAELVDPAGPTSASNLSVVTAQGVVVGTPQYMSREQLRAERLDGRCDQFAWGVVAYELLSGKLPWGPVSGVQLIACLLDPHAPPLLEVVPDLDPPMAAAVDRALQGSRDARFATMEDLAAFVTGTSPRGVVPSSRKLPASASGPLARTELAATSRRAPRWRLTVVAGAAIAVAIGAIGAGLVLSRSALHVDRPVPSALASALPTETPSPSGRVPEGATARAAYQAALQSFEDGQSDAWRHNLEAVVDADPGFGAAYLWLGHLWLGDDDPRARAYYAKASQLRASLGEIDAALLEALEPRFRDPPDRAERLVRMEKLGARYPRDTTVQYMLGLAYLSVFRYPDAKRTFDALIALDPKFAFAYANLIFVAQYEGDAAQAQALVDRCIAACPVSIDCSQKRVELEGLRGDCRAMMADGKNLLSRDARSSTTYEMLASAMATLGEPRASVSEMLGRASAAESVDRAFDEPLRSAAVAVFFGDFTSALRASVAAEAVLAGQPDRSPVAVELDRLALLAEIGDRAGLRALATSLRSRLGAWGPATDSSETIALSGFERQAGLISRDELRTRRQTWMRARADARAKDGSKRDPFWDWAVAFAATVGDRDDAREALDALRPYLPVPGGVSMDASVNADLGHVYARAEAFPDAVAPLQLATRACTGLMWPRASTQAFFDLGLSLEHTGDLRAARAAYGTVLQRWGDAKPRSVTAESARARLNGLAR